MAEELSSGKLLAHAQLVEVHPAEVRGQKIHIWVNADGIFQTSLDGGSDVIRSATRAGLTEAVSGRLREASVRVEVPFMHLYNGHARRGTATGVHSGNQNILVTWEDGWKGQLDRYGETKLPMSDEEITEWDRLRRAWRQAHDDLDRFEAARRLDLKARVAAAIGEAVKSDG